MKKRVWFNQGLSNVYDAIRIARRADRARQLTFLASHSVREAPVRTVAQEAWDEPRGFDDESYVAWCVRTCQERAVDLFIPGTRRRAIAAHAYRFEQHGTRVGVLAPAAVLDVVSDKSATYRALEGVGVRIPPYMVFRNLDEFNRAYDLLRTTCEWLCVKPTRGMYASGFYRIEENGDELAHLLSGEKTRIGVETFRRVLAATHGTYDLMLMEYLPGLEQSVDALAHGGELVSAMARAKHPGFQQIDVAGDAVDFARVAARHFGFDGLFNLQTRDARGHTYLLEINSRMSGGAFYASRAGIALPYWAVLLWLGLCEPEEVPKPAGGVKVAPVNACVVLPK